MRIAAAVQRLINRAGYKITRIDRSPPFVPRQKEFNSDLAKFDYWVAHEEYDSWYDPRSWARAASIGRFATSSSLATASLKSVATSA
jgi:hypothetical protein